MELAMLLAPQLALLWRRGPRDANRIKRTDSYRRPVDVVEEHSAEPGGAKSKDDGAVFGQDVRNVRLRFHSSQLLVDCNAVDRPPIFTEIIAAVVS